MSSRTIAGEFSPLQIYLKNLLSPRVTLSFKEIEIILQSELPEPAYEYHAWWINSRIAFSHASTWLDAGYETAKIKLGEWVEFIKIDPIFPETKIKNYLFNEETDYIKKLSDKMDRTKDYLIAERAANLSEKSLLSQFETINQFRKMIGNINSDLNFLGCLMIKEYLEMHYSFSELNIALKPQGFPGFDIDERTLDGKRIIGELKTAYPNSENDLGANQRNHFIRDFEKLQKTIADHKYFFVTEPKTYEIIQNKYSYHLQGITLVLLPQALT